MIFTLLRCKHESDIGSSNNVDGRRILIGFYVDTSAGDKWEIWGDLLGLLACKVSRLGLQPVPAPPRPRKVANKARELLSTRKPHLASLPCHRLHSDSVRSERASGRGCSHGDGQQGQPFRKRHQQARGPWTQLRPQPPPGTNTDLNRQVMTHQARPPARKPSSTADRVTDPRCRPKN